MSGFALAGLVAVGGAVGAVLRFVAGHLLDDDLPWGVGMVNTAGSFGLGLCTGWALDGAALALLGAGLCGSLTTWSSFLVGAHEMGGRRGAAYVALTLATALPACALGFWLAQE